MTNSVEATPRSETPDTTAAVVELIAEPLDALRRLSGLSAQGTGDVFEHFAHYADGNGTLSLDAYIDAFSLFVPADVSYQTNTDAVVAVRVALFRLFDEDVTGVADFAHVMCGLSVLCGDSRQSKVAACFNLLSLTDDGSLTKFDLTVYLRSVFRVLFLADDSLSHEAGTTADGLASTTTDDVFSDLGLNPRDTVNAEVCYCVRRPFFERTEFQL